MNLSRLWIFARDSELINQLKNGLTLRGYACTIIYSKDALTSANESDLLLIEPGDWLSGSDLKQFTRRIKQERHLPVILLADKDTLRQIEDVSDIEDFILKPYDIDELTQRISRLMKKNTSAPESSEHLKAGDIVIDLPRCEVWVRGKVVDLTFTEYELLKLLVSKKGQVLTREVLLNKIWGYDYFGGDRTVDVHITRLRSKIEDLSHNLIETVRNIGYRIKIDGK